MESKQHQEMVQEAVRQKFKRNKPSLKATSAPHYPSSAEREYRRLSNAYMNILNKTLKKNLPDIIAILEQNTRADAAGVRDSGTRILGAGNVESRIRYKIAEMTQELAEALEELGLDVKLEKISALAEANSVREWKRMVRQTLGIDIFDDYYRGDFYKGAVRKWVEDNVAMIKTVPQDSLGKLQDIILTGYREGKTIPVIRKSIMASYLVTKHTATFWARDQIAKLNASITEAQHRDAGVRTYIWSTSRDERVRDCHRALDGKEFSYDDPPEMWYMTKSRGKVMTGRKCNPGQDYCCRCVAIPVFNIESIDLPMKEILKAAKKT